MKKNSILFIFIVLVIGMLIGTIFSMVASAIIPEGVVKDFFLIKKSIGWGATSNNWVELGFFRFKSGVFLDLSILSIFGFFVSWYLLRYFK
jgi:lipoprotein signal peptidase